MEDKYEFDIGWLLLILSVLDGNNKKGSEENGNESKGSKDIVVLDKEN